MSGFFSSLVLIQFFKKRPMASEKKIAVMNFYFLLKKGLDSAQIFVDARSTL